MNNLDFVNLSPTQKGAIVLGDIAPNGVLPDEVAEKFIVLAIKDQKLLRMIRVLPMKNNVKRIPKIVMASRILRAGTSNQALPPADYAKPTFSRSTLTAKLFRGAVAIPDEVYEDNVERDKLKSTIQGMVAEKLGADMEEVSILGDTTSTDPFLAQIDGFIKQATSNTVTASGPITRALLKAAFKKVPIQYRKDKTKVGYFTSTNAEIDYRDSLADRATNLGDTRLTDDGGPVRYSGIPLHDIPLFPYELGSGTNETVMLFTNPLNMVVGVQRDIRIEGKRSPETSSDEWHITLRMDATYEEETAVSKTTGITN